MLSDSLSIQTELLPVLFAQGHVVLSSVDSDIISITIIALLIDTQQCYCIILGCFI